MVIEEILLPTIFVIEFASLGYFKTSDFFFWLICLVHSPQSLTTIIDYHEIPTFLH